MPCAYRFRSFSKDSQSPSTAAVMSRMCTMGRKGRYKKSSEFMAVLEAPQEAIHNQTFNFGQTAENYRIRELAAIVADTVPGPGGPDKRCYRINCDKIRRVLAGF